MKPLPVELKRGADFHASAPKTVHTEQPAVTYTDPTGPLQVRKTRPTDEALNLADRLQHRIAELEWADDPEAEAKVFYLEHLCNGLRSGEITALQARQDMEAAADVRSWGAASGSSSIASHETEPDFQTGKTFPLRVFPEWLRTYAKEVAASCEVPVSVVGFGILGMLSACCGMHIKIAIKNRYAPFCHDWFFLIAKVSLGKSPIFSHLQAPLQQIEKTLKDVIVNGDETKFIRCMINDATPEAMNKAQAENGGAVALVSPETPLLSQMASTARPIPLQPYLSSHTGEPYSMLRITRDPTDIDRARLAIFAATQDAGLREVTQRPEILSRGIIARCSFFVAPAIQEADLQDDDPEVTEELAQRYERTLRELGLRLRGQEDPMLLIMLPEVREARQKWRNQFKRRHRLEGGDLHDLTDHASKLEDKLCRWAGLLHLLWADHEGRKLGLVGLDDWRRARDLLDFDLYHYRAALDVIQEGPADALARKLRGWTRSRKGQTIRLRDLRRHLRAFKQASEDIQRQAIQLLQDERRLRFIEDSNPVSGTPSPAIEVL